MPPSTQVGNKNKMENSKKRGPARGDIIVDPARRRVVDKAIVVRQGHRGRGSRNCTQPESPSPSQSPPRGCAYSMVPEITTSAKTTIVPHATTGGKRRAGGAEESRHRCANRGTSQAPQTMPLTVEELREGVLTEEAIRNAAGGVTKQQLRGITKLTLVIDSSQVSIDGVWDAVPNLHTLALNGSRLLSFRDLGVGLRHLNTLSLESSYVEDLDGIGALAGLRELRLACNRVSDVTPLACHGSLQVLDLQRNRVSDVNALEVLSSVPLLYSLNLSRNPLMESLGKLRDGKGGGVVRRLIPQIRILDGTHLSSGEGGGVDEQILDEVDDLVCQGASRARATWATEKEAEAAALATASAMVSTEGVQGGQRRVGGANGGGGGSKERGEESGEPSFLAELDDYSPHRPWMSNVPAAAAATETQVGMRGSPSAPQLPDQGGMMHWDSDLTQGGREALFGNPSSAIRRHKWEKGDGTGRNGHSPTRVLETLDLAKIMERGLKQRRSTQQSADRVSEWRRETRSDSVPQEDSPFAPPGGHVLLLRRDDPPVPSTDFHNVSERQRRPEDNRAELSSTPVDTGTVTWASLSTSGARGLNAARADNDARWMTPTGAEGAGLPSGRPWTTGGFGRGSQPTASAAAAAVVEAYGTSRPEGEKGADAVGGGDDASRPGCETRLHPRRRRPQTAKEPGKRRGFPHSEDSDTLQNGSGCTSWQAVWESLQTAQLICTPRTDQTSMAKMTGNTTKEGGGGEEGGLISNSMPRPEEGLHRKVRSVDFGRQRRARATARAIQAAGGNFLHDYDSSHSAPDEEAGSSGGDDSDEVGDRNQIKKRASDFSFSDKKEPCASVVPRPPPSDPSSSSELSPCFTSAMRIAAFSRNGIAHQRADDVKPAEACNTSTRTNSVPNFKTRRRETASLVARRSLEVMDADTSSGGSCSSDNDQGFSVRKASKFAGSGGNFTQQSVVSNGKGVCGGRGSTSGVVGGDSDSDDDGWSLSQRRISSTHASRKLGFDLRKSLAAIDEWTDMAPTAIKAGSGCGGTPRKGETKAGGRPKPVSFFVEPSPERGTAPVPSLPFSLHNSTRRKADEGSLGSATRPDAKVARERQSTPMSTETDAGGRVRERITPETTNSEDDIRSGGASGDDDEGEAVLSVAEARAALGISKGVTLATRGIVNTTPRVSLTGVGPSAAEIDAITAQAGGGVKPINATSAVPRTSLEDNWLAQPDSSRSSSSRSSQHVDGSSVTKTKPRGHGRPREAHAPGKRVARPAASPRTARPPGTAVGMSDEDLKGMLQKQPRTVPELRTKASFREFFQGMEAERMGRLLRVAYEESLPADQVEKKVKKRLGLVGDMLAW